MEMRLKNTLAWRLGNMALMCSCEQYKKICIPDFCLTISEYLSVQIWLIYTIMEKEKMCFWDTFRFKE